MSPLVSAPDPSTPDQRLSACARLVRRYDHDRFLIALFANEAAREAMFAVYAFNLEIAKTREVVTEPTLGLIRLQWWRETIDGIYRGDIRQHEVAVPLAAAIARHDLSRAHFEQVIDARESDLTDDIPDTMEALEAYGEATASPLLQLSLEALGVRDHAASEAARHIAIAWALVGIARAVPFHARQRRILIPRTVLEEENVDRGAVLAMKPSPGLERAVLRLSQAAWLHLNAARAARAAVPAAAFPALLSASLVESHLKTLARAGQNPFDQRVQTGNPLRQAKLMMKATLGRY